MKPAFTIIEALLILGIIAIIASCVVVATHEPVPHECEQYAELPIQEVPAKCQRYFGSRSAPVPIFIPMPR